MLLLYVGIVDVTRGVIASRKLDLLSRTISDLVSQQQTNTPMTTAQLSAILAASSALMAPFSTANLTMTVSAVDIEAKNGTTTCCDAVVRWTYTQGGVQRACSPALQQVPNGTPPSPTNFPVAIISANQNAGFNYAGGQVSYIIVSDVRYTYAPLLQQAISWFAQGMSKTNYMVPRSASGPITLNNPINPPAGQAGTICFS